MSKILTKNHAKLVLGAAERNYQNNLKKFDNMTKEQVYMLAYLHGYEACFEDYDIGGGMEGENKPTID